MQRVLIFPHNTLICGICYELLDSPHECNSCHNLFCEECINEYLNSKEKFRRIYFCPICRSKKNSFSKNIKLNNILEKYKNSDKKICPKCYSILEQEKYDCHINKCWFKCSFCHELFSNENKFINHFIKDKTHDFNLVIDKFNRKENNSLSENKNKTGEKLKEHDFGKIKREKFENNLKEDNCIKDEKILNEIEGYNIIYDLYFCGKRNGINCKCCINKTCSPYGEMCPQCMKKNIKLHGLKGYYLINKKGRACKFNYGQFHCYSKFEIIITDKAGNFYRDEKICSNKNTCEACKYMTKIMNYYLPTNIIKKLFERDVKIKNKKKCNKKQNIFL